MWGFGGIFAGARVLSSIGKRAEFALLSGALLAVALGTSGCLPNSGQSLRSLQALGSGGSSNQTNVFGTGTSSTGSDGEEVGEDGAQDQCLAFDETSSTRPLCINCYDDLLATYCPGKSSYEECSDRGFISAFPTLLNQCVAASTVAGFVCSKTCLTPKVLDEESCSCVDPDLSTTGLSSIQRMDRGQFDIGPPVVTASFPQSGITGFGTADSGTPDSVSQCTATLNSASSMSSIFLAIRNRGETLVRNNRMSAPVVTSLDPPGTPTRYLTASAPGLLSTPVFGQNGFLNFQFETGGTSEVTVAKFSGEPGALTRLIGESESNPSVLPTTPATADIPADASLVDYSGLGRPYMMASDQFGNIYFTDEINGTIHVICHDVASSDADANLWCEGETLGDVRRIAGGGSNITVDTNTGGVGTDELLFAPRGIAVDDRGNVYFSAQRFDDGQNEDQTELGPYIGVVCGDASQGFCSKYTLDSNGATLESRVYRIYGGAQIKASGLDVVLAGISNPFDLSTHQNITHHDLGLSTDFDSDGAYDNGGGISDDFEEVIITGLDVNVDLDGDLEVVYVIQPERNESAESGSTKPDSKTRSVWAFATDPTNSLLEMAGSGSGGNAVATKLGQLTESEGYLFDVKRNKNNNLILSGYNPGALWVWCHDLDEGDFCDKDVHGKASDVPLHTLTSITDPSTSSITDSVDGALVKDSVFSAPGQLIVSKKYSNDYAVDTDYDDNNVVIVSLQKLVNGGELFQQESPAGGSTLRVLCGDNSGNTETDGWCKNREIGRVYDVTGIAGESSIAASGSAAKGAFAGSPIGGVYDKFKNILFTSGWRLTQHLNASSSEVPFIDNSIMRVEYLTETPVSNAKYTFTDSNNLSSYYCLRLKAKQACAYNFDATEGFVTTCSCQLLPSVGDAGSFWTSATSTGTCN